VFGQITALITGIYMICMVEREIPDFYTNLVNSHQVQRSEKHTIKRAECDRYYFIFSQCMIDISSNTSSGNEKSVRIWQTFLGSVNGKTVYPVVVGASPGRVTVNLGFEHMDERLWAMIFWLCGGAFLMIAPLFGLLSSPPEPISDAERIYDHWGGKSLLDDKLKF